MKINTLAASLFCLTSLVLGEVAMATPEITKEVERDHLNLLGLIEALGVEVAFDGYPCEQGWHGGYKHDGSQLVLCPEATTDQYERLDTIRHEAWHVLQDMVDCNLKDEVVAQPMFMEGMVSKPFMDAAAKHYDTDRVASEAEAGWAADTFEARHINILLFTKAKSCGYKF